LLPTPPPASDPQPNGILPATSQAQPQGEVQDEAQGEGEQATEEMPSPVVTVLPPAPPSPVLSGDHKRVLIPSNSLPLATPAPAIVTTDSSSPAAAASPASPSPSLSPRHTPRSIDTSQAQANTDKAREAIAALQRSLRGGLGDLPKATTAAAPPAPAPAAATQPSAPTVPPATAAPSETSLPAPPPAADQSTDAAPAGEGKTNPRTAVRSASLAEQLFAQINEHFDY
jgi:hypothetical protein